MKHPLALKAYIIWTAFFDFLALVYGVVYILQSPSPVYPFYTFWAILTYVIVYGVLYTALLYGLWIGNRIAYAIVWIVEIVPWLIGWLIGIQVFLSGLWKVLPVSYAIAESVMEWILLALSWKHFFKRSS